jgi:hypothetical protein
MYSVLPRTGPECLERHLIRTARDAPLLGALGDRPHCIDGPPIWSSAKEYVNSSHQLVGITSQEDGCAMTLVVLVWDECVLVATAAP